MLARQGMGAKTFEELRAWRLAAELSDRIVAVCATSPLQGDLTFRDQLRDAAEAAPRPIAEGFGRWSRREFARYLVMARSERMEVRSDLLALQRRRTLPGELAAELLELTDHALRTTSRLRSSLPP
jgi:four helix bundle protein